MLQHFRQWLDPAVVEHAEHLALHAGRVRQRSEEIEDRADAKLGAHRRPVLHRRVVHRRPHEADTGLGDGARNGDGRHVELDAERGQHVGGTRQRGDGAVAVLGDLHPGAGRDQCRAGRDVIGAVSVAAGADDVDRVGRRVDGEHARAHASARARDLRDRLAAHAQRHQERCHLHRAGDARGHRLERGRHLLLVSLAPWLPSAAGAQFLRGLASIGGLRRRRGHGRVAPARAHAGNGRGSLRAARGRARRRCSRDGTARRAPDAACAAVP